MMQLNHDITTCWPLNCQLCCLWKCNHAPLWTEQFSLAVMVSWINLYRLNLTVSTVTVNINMVVLTGPVTGQLDTNYTLLAGWYKKLTGSLLKKLNETAPCSELLLVRGYEDLKNNTTNGHLLPFGQNDILNQARQSQLGMISGISMGFIQPTHLLMFILGLKTAHWVNNLILFKINVPRPWPDRSDHKDQFQEISSTRMSRALQNTQTIDVLRFLI